MRLPKVDVRPGFPGHLPGFFPDTFVVRRLASCSGADSHRKGKTPMKIEIYMIGLAIAPSDALGA